MVNDDDAIPISCCLIAWLIYKEKISTTPSLDGGVGTPQRGDKRRGLNKTEIERTGKDAGRRPGFWDFFLLRGSGSAATQWQKRTVIRLLYFIILICQTRYEKGVIPSKEQHLILLLLL